MTINEKILRLRKVRGLTQAELGEKLGVTDKAVSKWEQGNGMPDLEQIQSLGEFFGVSLDYLLKDVLMTGGDIKAKSELEEQEQKVETKGKNDDLRENCKKYLEEQGVVAFDEKILPFVEDDGKTINYGCFDIKGDNISLSYQKLLEYCQGDLVKKFFPSNVTPAEAIKMDDVDLLTIALKNYSSMCTEYNSLPHPGTYDFIQYTTDPEQLERQRRAEDLKEAIDATDINKLLENLDPNLKNFYQFIVMLIDAGAKYYKQVGEGDDVTVFWTVVDTSRTNFFYRVAKDKIQ